MKKRIESLYWFPTKKAMEELCEEMERRMENGDFVDDDVNRISIEKVKLYIERYDDVEDIIKIIENLLFKINEFKSMHHRSALIHQIITSLFLYVSLPPLERIGILENVKNYIFEESKRKVEERNE